MESSSMAVRLIRWPLAVSIKKKNHWGSSQVGSAEFLTTDVTFSSAPDLTLTYVSGLSWPTKDLKPPFFGNPDPLLTFKARTPLGSRQRVSMGSSPFEVGMNTLFG